MTGWARGGGMLASIAVVLGLASFGGAADESGDDPAIDCGPAALLALGAVEGRPIDYDRIAARLPQRREGHSMRELRDVARSFGLTLDGGYVGKDLRLIDRPMLAFIHDKGEKIDHFLVVRPVGHTGRLAQVIDSNGPPRVLDKAEIVASSQWTGVVLLPRRTNWVALSGATLLGAAGLLGLRLGIARRVHRGAQRVVPGGALPAG